MLSQDLYGQIENMERITKARYKTSTMKRGENSWIKCISNSTGKDESLYLGNMITKPYIVLYTENPVDSAFQQWTIGVIICATDSLMSVIRFNIAG